MTEKPILFSAPMINAILAGRKSMTRRIVKDSSKPCRFEVGMVLWVREACRIVYPQDVLTNGVLIPSLEPTRYLYAADDPSLGPWRPSIHMPRRASRISLEVTATRRERLQDISEADAIAEGMVYTHVHSIDDRESCYTDFRGYSTTYQFRLIWQSIHGPASWQANPLVDVISFKRIKP